MPTRRTLHARFVVPVVGEPIEGGFVSFEEGRIVEVGRSAPRGETIDLGNVALLPGLVNAHTHLEFSGLSQPLGSPGMGFVDWIREVIAWRMNHANDTAAAIADGLRQCAALGTTTLGNISRIDEPDDPFATSAGDGVRFVEIIAPHADSALEVVKFVADGLPARGQNANWRFGLSPHAPYSVHPQVLEAVVTAAAKQHLPLAMHLAESREELQLLEHGEGPLRDFLEERGIFDRANFPGRRRPLDYLKMLATAPRSLVVHGNYLNDEEIAFLAANAAKMAVVYCLRTHAYFGHDPYPLEKLLSAGVNVALGTDSRASSPDLSLLAEMRFVARRYPQLAPEKVLALGTIDSARALGRADDLGSLERGKWANFAVVALPDRAVGDPCRLLLECDEPVVQTWHRGQRIAGS